MKRKELKSKILEAYTNETPDLRSKILESCENEEQEPIVVSEMKKESSKGKIKFNFIFKSAIAVAACVIFFVAGLSTGLFKQNKSEIPMVDVENYIYIDVNPSIELQTDGKNTVLKCIAANEDAEIILEGLQLEGVEMNTALTAVVGAMFVNGYLGDESNSILISVDGKDDNITDDLLSKITSNINKTFEKSELECSIIAQSVKVNENLRKRAKKNDISVGKMHLVDKMVNGLEEYAQEDESILAGMSIKELNLIYDERPNKGSEEDPFDEDISYGKVSGIVDKDDALKTILNSIGVDISAIDDCDIKVKLGNDDKKNKTVYKMNIKFKDDCNVYNYEVGCEKGEILKKDEKDPHEKQGVDKDNSNKSNSNENKEEVSKDEINKPNIDIETDKKTHENMESSTSSKVQEDIKKQLENEVSIPNTEKNLNGALDENVELPSDLDNEEDIKISPEIIVGNPSVDEKNDNELHENKELPKGLNYKEDVELCPKN